MEIQAIIIQKQIHLSRIFYNNKDLQWIKIKKNVTIKRKI